MSVTKTLRVISRQRNANRSLSEMPPGAHGDGCRGDTGNHADVLTRTRRNEDPRASRVGTWNDAAVRGNRVAVPQRFKCRAVPRPWNPAPGDALVRVRIHTKSCVCMRVRSSMSQSSERWGNANVHRRVEGDVNGVSLYNEVSPAHRCFSYTPPGGGRPGVYRVYWTDRCGTASLPRGGGVSPQVSVQAKLREAVFHLPRGP